MSWRRSSSLQPTAQTPNTVKKKMRRTEALIFIVHLGHIFRADAFKKLGGLSQIEFLVRRFNAQKKCVVRRALETRNRKEGAVRLWKLVERQHAEHGE